MARDSWHGDSRCPSGVSRIGVVVTISIVCLGAAIAFPLMGKYMDTVAKNRCANNLSSIGRAIAAYQAAHGNAWPMASTEPLDCAPASTRETLRLSRRDTDGPQQFRKHAGYSWIVALLPYLNEDYMHQQILSKSAVFELDSFDPSIVDSRSGTHVSMMTSRVLYCDAIVGGGDESIVSNAPEYRRLAKQFPRQNAGVGLTNFLALAATHLALVTPGADGSLPEPDGVIAYFPSGKGVVRIPDGDKHTLVITESCEQDYASWYDGATSWVVAHDPNSREPIVHQFGRIDCQDDRGCRSSLAASLAVVAGDESEAAFYRRDWPGEEPWCYGPSSRHAGGIVNHLYGDKRVVPICGSGPNQIDSQLYLALVTRKGHEFPACEPCGDEAP